MIKHNYLLSVFRIELRQIFAYAVDFWVNFFGKMLTQVIIAYFLWGNIYQNNKEAVLEGYSFKGIIIYFTIAPLLLRVLQGANIGSISREIYEGGLTKYLLYPVNYYYYKITSYMAHALIYLLQLLFVFSIIYFFIGFPSEFQITLSSTLMGIMAALLATLIYFAMASILEMVSFWADNIWSLLVMLRFVVSFLGGAFIPISFFPETYQGLIEYTPFYYLISFPMKCLLGQIEGSTFFAGLIIMLFWYIFFQLLSALTFKKGCYKYTGVGI